MMSNILETAKNEVAALSNNDFLILWAGSNDINENNMSEARMGLVKFLDDHTGVNIILLNAPLRYDLISTSCVNREIFKFNRQIKKILKLYPNTRGLNIDLQRQFFTQHGQHLNNNGKELIAGKLAKVILQYFEKSAMDSIQLSWNEDNSQRKT
jgi:hypothetical protein